MIAAALTLSLALAGLPQSTEPAAEPAFDHSHAAWTTILEGAVEDEMVDYAALRRAPDALDRYLATLAATTPAQHEGWTRDERFAFWVNAYNAFTIQLIRDEGPVKSIKKIGGLFSSPWKKKFIPMPAFDPERKNKKITLDEIEHDILRKAPFADARVHAAINCASRSCPPLRTEAFQAELLDKQLDEQVAQWLTDPARNELRPRKGKVQISEIFKWFEEDFVRRRKGGDDERVLLWIADHHPDKALAEQLRRDASTIKIRYLDYDWSINALPERR